MMMMAPGLSIDKSIYLFFHPPFTCSTCSIPAKCVFASPPLHANEPASFARSSPVDVMHTASSVLISCLAFLLFRLDSSASTVLPRQASAASPSVYNTRFPSVTWDNDLWRVTTTALDQGHYQSRQSIANGYIGGLGHPDDRR